MPSDDLPAGTWVSAHRPDRMGTVVIGELLPYDPNIGEQVRDEHGEVWGVVAASVRPLPIPEEAEHAQQ